MLTLSQTRPKLLYFYVHSRSINIPPLSLPQHNTNALDSPSPLFSPTGDAEVDVLGCYRKEATAHLLV